MGRAGARVLALLVLAGLGSAVTVAPPVAARPAPDDGLSAVKARLDDMALRRGAPREVTAWWADPATRSVVLAVDRRPRDARGAAYLEDARRVDPRVRVREGMPGVAPRDDLVGGDAIYLGGARCSVGFGARTGAGAARMITAGHCTRSGGDVRGTNTTPIGPVRSSVFNRDGDWGVVDVGPPWVPTPQVAAAGSTTLRVTGPATAAVGASVCRSGSTTGWRCGQVTAVDVTANYASGPVLGLTLTTACSEPGDSGGPFVAGGAALGVLSGGSGDCASSGGSTLYQPIAEVLAREGLTLVTM